MERNHPSDRTWTNADESNDGDEKQLETGAVGGENFARETSPAQQSLFAAACGNSGVLSREGIMNSHMKFFIGMANEGPFSRSHPPSMVSQISGRRSRIVGQTHLSSRDVRMLQTSRYAHDDVRPRQHETNERRPMLRCTATTTFRLGRGRTSTWAVHATELSKGALTTDWAGGDRTADANLSTLRQNTTGKQPPRSRPKNGSNEPITNQPIRRQLHNSDDDNRSRVVNRRSSKLSSTCRSKRPMTYKSKSSSRSGSDGDADESLC